jgi:ABC-2 type transport system permease protein
MRAYLKLTLTLAKLYLRDPVGAFFTLAFAPLFVVLLGAISGNDPNPLLGGLGYLDANLPAYAAIVVGMVGLLTVPIGTVTRRESGVLRRFMATPLRPLTYLAADVSVYLVMTLLGIVLAFLTGMIGFGVRFQGDMLGVMAGTGLGTLAFMALGYALAGLIPTTQVAQVVGNILAFPLLALSGATVPLEVLPPAAQNIARFFPLTHLVNLLRGLWLGEGWQRHVTETVVLTGMLLAGAALAAWVFRWE